MISPLKTRIRFVELGWFKNTPSSAKFKRTWSTDWLAPYFETNPQCSNCDDLSPCEPTLSMMLDFLGVIIFYQHGWCTIQIQSFENLSEPARFQWRIIDAQCSRKTDNAHAFTGWNTSISSMDSAVKVGFCRESWQGLGLMSLFWKFKHHQNTYLLEIVSPIVGWCSIGTYTKPWLGWCSCFELVFDTFGVWLHVKSWTLLKSKSTCSGLFP